MARNLQLFILAIFIFGSYSKTYEGYIILKEEDNQPKLVPIWVDLENSSNSCTGSYFYRKVGTPIALKGTTSGTTTTLTETSGGKITGIWNIVDYRDSLIGTWKPSASSKPVPVKLFIADLANKQYAIWNPKSLNLAKNERDFTTLDQELESGRDHGSFTKDQSKPKPNVLICQSTILSLSTDYDYTGAYTSEWRTVHTFDLKTKREIVLFNEIDPSKKGAFESIITQRVKANVRTYKNEEEDISELVKTKLANPSIVPTNVECNIDCLALSYENYFGLSHAFQAIDISFKIPFSYNDLLPYLRENSPLRRLAR